jgi:hypothetical protein
MNNVDRKILFNGVDMQAPNLLQCTAGNYELIKTV